MTDLNIPNLNKKSDKYLFKNKLAKRRKSKRKLVAESIYMLILSFLLAYLNYLIPNKVLIFNNFLNNFEKGFVLLTESFYYIFQIFLVVFILISLILAIILFFGSFYRIVKVFKIKTKQISYK